MKYAQAAVALAVLMLGGARAEAEPLQTMDAVGAALLACWTPPETQGSVTLSFSIKRDGTLIGAPQPMAIAIDADEDARKAFIDAAVAAVEQCTPLDLAPALADGIAGSVYSMKFSSPSSAAAPISN
jgi:hypothetical protein